MDGNNPLQPAHWSHCYVKEQASQCESHTAYPYPGIMLPVPPLPLSLSDIQSVLQPVGTEGADTPVATAPVPAQGAPSLHTHTHVYRFLPSQVIYVV